MTTKAREKHEENFYSKSGFSSSPLISRSRGFHKKSSQVNKDIHSSTQYENFKLNMSHDSRQSIFTKNSLIGKEPITSFGQVSHYITNYVKELSEKRGIKQKLALTSYEAKRASPRYRLKQTLNIQKNVTRDNSSEEIFSNNAIKTSINTFYNTRKAVANDLTKLDQPISPTSPPHKDNTKQTRFEAK